ncbi:hypothetical protein BD410DRAFT_797481 [Rickenella mellea]|uniref:Uncharacterized protein n=1 Tax=Rickenella mellea TaxID=50990 RepID=A0A4Y7PH14_9AGAM|nr:hypothetical protein BD410DRAFT_797481 [Rickenella mellea]
MASVNNVPARISCDHSRVSSAISRNFCALLNLSEESVLQSCQATVSVPAQSIPGCLTSSLHFEVVEDLGQFDVVLGTDWLELARPSIRDGFISRPPNCSSPSDQEDFGGGVCFRSTYMSHALTMHRSMKHCCHLSHQTLKCCHLLKSTPMRVLIIQL